MTEASERDFESLKHKQREAADNPVDGAKSLERFARPSREGVRLRVVTAICDEFTSLCPITSQPDFTKIEISYTPRKWCIESKSLKLYLQSFRNYGAFAEDLACIIASDLSKLLECGVSVRTTQKPRGGIELVSLAESIPDVMARLLHDIEHGEVSMVEIPLGLSTTEPEGALSRDN